MVEVKFWKELVGNQCRHSACLIAGMLPCRMVTGFAENINGGFAPFKQYKDPRKAYWNLAIIIM